MREELHYIERGEGYSQRKEVYEKLHPETKVGTTGGGLDGKGVRWKTDFAQDAKSVPSFIEDTTKKVKDSARKIYLEIQIADNLPKEVKEIILDYSGS